MDQFEVLQTLGRGSFGVVRKVRRRSDDKTLVVKEMDYGSADNKQKEQIVAEVNILRELRHPFIVRYYDRIVDRRRTRLHIIMEHCSTDLARVIRATRLRGEYLEETFLWNLLCQVVVALEYCHGRTDKGGARKPVVHRDLKPENVFLTDDNIVKLGDFGLATELQGAQLARTSVGTPYYMSPELINEQRYDERTDVWSLGCLLYEAAALSRPFNAHNHLALAVKINTGKVEPIPSRYSPGLFATIEWMLNRVRHRRPRTEDLIKVPGLQVYLKENRLLVREYRLQQSYVQRIRDLKSRESEMARREAALAANEAALRRRTEAFALLEHERRESSSRSGSSPRYTERRRQSWAVGAPGRDRGRHECEAGDDDSDRPHPVEDVDRREEEGTGKWVGDTGSHSDMTAAATPCAGKLEDEADITEATTAVLDYAAIALHNSRPADRATHLCQTAEGHHGEGAKSGSHSNDTVSLDSGNVVMQKTVTRDSYHAGVSSAFEACLDRERRSRVAEAKIYSPRLDAAAAAGRRARESYAGYIKTLSAAREHGAWAEGRGKENRHPRGKTSARPRLSPTAPLVEVLEGGGRYKHAGYRIDGKEARVAPRRGYQRSASDLPTPTKLAMTPGVGVGAGPRRSGTEHALTAAGAMPRPRRYRLSRF